MKRSPSEDNRLFLPNKKRETAYTTRFSSATLEPWTSTSSLSWNAGSRQHHVSMTSTGGNEPAATPPLSEANMEGPPPVDQTMQEAPEIPNVQDAVPAEIVMESGTTDDIINGMMGNDTHRQWADQISQRLNTVVSPT
eukprot:588784-Amphidinium_carterae.2